MGSMGVRLPRPWLWGWAILGWRSCREVDITMNLRRWVLVYLATGPSFTRWAILAFYGGAVVVIAFVILILLVIVGR